ncbi:hypothetical protein JL100_008555 [Skermanella mucosa]|uniref:hypothetical protein n=1 Tax=Skermanella mucosa TaxID=1789672 RepID=UPI00192BF90E|nr:hypothetical protein [Skermanella mucosa]UEM22781.1 hypothetical protein JL100_008555 [Skermanella mucosa]
MRRHFIRKAPDRREIALMLSALEKQAKEAASLADRAHGEASRDSYTAYFRFRAKVDEVQALIALIEERLGRMEDDQAEELREQFRRLDAAVLVMLVRTSTRFYALMEKSNALPLGARELFLPELRTLSEVRDRVTAQPEHAALQAAGLLEALELALGMVEGLVARAPSLPDFSQPDFSQPGRRR